MAMADLFPPSGLDTCNRTRPAGRPQVCYRASTRSQFATVASSAAGPTATRTSCSCSSRASRTRPPGRTAAVERHRRTTAPPAAQRALPHRGPPHLVQDHRGDAGGSRHLPRRLQSSPAAPGPLHGWPHPAQAFTDGLPHYPAKKDRTKTPTPRGRLTQPRNGSVRRLSSPYTIYSDLQDNGRDSNGPHASE